MTPIAPHIEAFLRDRLPRQRGASQHTCETYAYALKLLFEYASTRFKVRPCQLALEQIDAPLIMDFLVMLESQRANCPSTRNARLVAIKSFMAFIEHRAPAFLEQCRQIRAIPAKKTVVPLVQHLNREEIQALLDAPDPATRAGLRDRAMLHLCFAAGLRVSELVALPLASLSLHADPSLRVLGKGRRERTLPLWKQTAADLRSWLAVRDAQAGVTELFINARGLPITRSGFECILAKHVSTAATKCPSLAAKRISPHVLRHSCALMILQATGDLRKVALWLGHADIQTTQMYLRIDPTEKLAALADVIPPSLRPGRFKAPDALIAMLRPTGICSANNPRNPRFGDGAQSNCA
jgi:site-specific recombinase XerD